MILLDTHVLVWLDQGSDLLGRRALKAIEAAYQRDEVAVAAVSFWEIGMLIEKGRLAFTGELRQWRVGLLSSGFQEFSSDGSVALAAAGLREFPGDPVDRLIAATGVAEAARLVTADERLLGYRGLKTMSGLS